MGIPFEAKRTGLARILFAILHPRHARAASVNAGAVRLLFGSGSTDISLGDVELVDVAGGRLYSGVRIRHTAGSTHVSGLPRTDASALADALETTRCEWWHRTLAPHLETLRSVHDRLTALTDPPKHLTADEIRDLKAEAQTAAGGFTARWPEALSDAPEIRMLRDILEFLEAPGEARTKANEAFVVNELARSRELFDRIEARPLTEEQRRAVVIDERRNLVVAAAGSGKTSVIVAKTGWLVRKGYRKPSELLLLAFARDARREMEERMERRLGAAIARDVTVRTFHGLGMAIIGEAEGKRPTLATAAENDRTLFDLLKGIVADLLADGELSATLHGWFREGFAPYKSEHEFRHWGEYHDYIRKFDIRSLKGETVRSFEECEIANFLYLNGIAYEYEAPYEHDLATSAKRQYKPDFHLPEHGIYIEHFGINAAGNTAPFVDREQYRLDMDWKRGVHAEHGTVLVETFSHEQAAGRLLHNLTEKLAAHGVTLSPIPREDVFASLKQQGRIDPFTRLVATFLPHFKGSRLSFADVAERTGTHRDRKRAQAFLAVFRPIFERYQEALASSGEIDFHDMINRATDLVETGRYRSPFGYILVDEFQDISPSRARLLKALLDSSPGSQLFAVGDDWEAIYRFGGSDIAVMREFRDHFGAFERIDLATTFRCADRIATVATDFVLRNPAQIRKTVRTTRKSDRPAVYVGLPGEQDLSLLKEAPRPYRGGCPPTRWHVRGTAAGPLPASAAPQPGRTSEAVSGPSLHLDDRASLEGSRSRLCGGPRSVFGKARVSRRDSRRSAARSGSGGARSSSERRGTTPSLCCRHPGETAGLPACRRRSALAIRHGVNRGRLRYRGVRPSAGRRRILSAMHGRPARAPRERPRRKRLLRLLEFPALRANGACLPPLRERPSRQVRRGLSLPRLWRRNRGLSALQRPG